jgi:hypothetical protein
MKPEFFHVETQLPDGTWQMFTAEPLEGRAAADEHLGKIREFAIEQKQDPERARLRELTPQDILQKLTQREKDDLISKYIESMPPGEFWRQVQNARLASGYRTEFEKWLDRKETG